jgi:hypothetical protein
MRGCLSILLLLVLVAATGYCIWQTHLLREEVSQLRAGQPELQQEMNDVMVERAQSILDALERRDFDGALRELDELAGVIKEAQVLADAQRSNLLRQVSEAREAVAERGERASALVEELADDIAEYRAEKRSSEGDEAPTEP